ncbi:MAG: hypothetical protein IJA02_08700 [Clostridia bacterium]|nr:hypothetical protein [Clostridia bacterium]
MRKIKLLHLVASLFAFKVIKDINGNEYVVYNDSHINKIESTVEDKTAFEAVENHVHIFGNIKKSDFEDACFIGEKIGEALFSSLKQAFPERNFIVFVSVSDEIIIRFHQKWENEPVYYDVNANYGKGHMLFAFE